MKKLLFSIVFFSAFITNAQVGIGTTNPNTNAVLDLTSTSKGLLLPRVDDTTNVPNPTAGLMVFNKNTNTTAVHNGVQWSSLITNLTASAVAAGDSITYSISGPGSSDFTAGEFPIGSISNGLSNSGTQVNYQDVHFTKLPDINSIAFIKKTSNSSITGLMEIKFYKHGTTTLLFSVKLTNWKCSSVQFGSSVNDTRTEQVSFNPQIIGFKDWTNNKSFAWNITTNVETTY
jgi:type VI protein secretion system component Hcp